MKVYKAEVVVDLFMLHMVDLRVILGNAWLRSIGRVLVDYNTMTMEFQINGKNHAWLATMTMKARKENGPARRIKELALWSKDGGMPSMWEEWLYA